MHIGILGFGKMGRSIAERLIEKGNQITAWNRTASKIEAVDHVTAVASPAALVGRCEMILSILANDAATEAAYHGADGLCSVPLAGTTIIEMCTMSPDRAMALAAAVTAKPLSNALLVGLSSPRAWRIGTAAGDRTDLTRARFWSS